MRAKTYRHRLNTWNPNVKSELNLFVLGLIRALKVKASRMDFLVCSYSPLPLQKGIYGHVEQLEENPNWFEIS